MTTLLILLSLSGLNLLLLVLLTLGHFKLTKGINELNTYYATLPEGAAPKLFKGIEGVRQQLSMTGDQILAAVTRIERAGNPWFAQASSQYRYPPLREVPRGAV